MQPHQECSWINGLPRPGKSVIIISCWVAQSVSGQGYGSQVLLWWKKAKTL